MVGVTRQALSLTRITQAVMAAVTVTAPLAFEVTIVSGLSVLLLAKFLARGVRLFHWNSRAAKHSSLNGGGGVTDAKEAHKRGIYADTCLAHVHTLPPSSRYYYLSFALSHPVSSVHPGPNFPSHPSSWHRLNNTLLLLKLIHSFALSTSFLHSIHFNLSFLSLFPLPRSLLLSPLSPHRRAFTSLDTTPPPCRRPTAPATMTLPPNPSCRRIIKTR